MKSSEKCILTRIIQQTEILKEIEWDNTKTRVIVPTQSSNTIISSLHQLFRATHEILTKEDENYVFQVLLNTVNEKLFNIIKSELVVTSDMGYTLLCEELDYLAEGFKGIFGEKLQMDVSVIDKAIKDIENVKVAHLV